MESKFSGWKYKPMCLTLRQACISLYGFLLEPPLEQGETEDSSEQNSREGCSLKTHKETPLQKTGMGSLVETGGSGE